ncbi:hypothetical protein BLNAU_14533 [Blattamonas nauphoetae]|uniref:Uncharacterized protein n=1 Tax=Blattamonas nauphoetae TaxID=2049346 RepID=A0ABQ9XFT0_9EUKA|nr:hypothetical protein BLNAU_14533 [Blattamonas nauphoetae]
MKTLTALVNSPGTLELPSFFPIEIGLTYPSDAEIGHFIVSLTEYFRNGHPLTQYVLDRACELFSQYEQRITDSRSFSSGHWFLFDYINNHTVLYTNEDSSWRIILSTNIPQLSFSVFRILASEITKMKPYDVLGLIGSGFVAILLSILEEQSLFSSPLSEPIHPALFTLFGNIIHHLAMCIKLNLSPSDPLPLFTSFLDQIRPFLLLHLKHPTLYPFPQKPPLADSFHLITAPGGTQPETDILANKTHSPILEIIHKILGAGKSSQPNISFVQDLMESAREERRKEGLAKGLERLPLFMTTRIASDMNSDDLVSILESCNDFILSHDSLSNDDCIEVAVFVLILHQFFHLDPSPNSPSLALFRSLLSESPQFVSSLAKLSVLAISSPSEMMRALFDYFLVDPLLFPKSTEMVDLVAESGFVSTLLQTARELDIPNSAHTQFYKLTIQPFIQIVFPYFRRLENSPVEQSTEGSAQFVVDRILVPCREFILLAARSPSQPIDHLMLPPTPTRHRQALSFFEGVWKEVREEAIGLVRKEGSAELPPFLTIDLFGQLESDSVQTALLSLSSFLLTHPTPPDPIAASIHLFLSTLATSRLPLQLDHRRPPFPRPLSSQSELLALVKWLSSNPTFASCFVQTVPSFFISSHRDIVMDTAELLHLIISESQRDVRLSLAQNGLIQRLVDVLNETAGSTDLAGKAKSDIWLASTIHRCLFKSVYLCLELFPRKTLLGSPPPPPLPTHADTIVLENVLIPSRQFLASFLSLATSEHRAHFETALSSILKTVGRVESAFPAISEVVGQIGFHLVSMQMCEVSLSVADKLSLLHFFEHTQPEFDRFAQLYNVPLHRPVQNDEQAFTTKKGAKFGRMMKGRNEEGFEDLMEQLGCLSPFPTIANLTENSFATLKHLKLEGRFGNDCVFVLSSSTLALVSFSISCPNSIFSPKSLVRSVGHSSFSISDSHFSNFQVSGEEPLLASSSTQFVQTSRSSFANISLPTPTDQLLLLARSFGEWELDGCEIANTCGATSGIVFCDTNWASSFICSNSSFLDSPSLTTTPNHDSDDPIIYFNTTWTINATGSDGKACVNVQGPRLIIHDCVFLQKVSRLAYQGLARAILFDSPRTNLSVFKTNITSFNHTEGAAILVRSGWIISLNQTILKSNSHTQRGGALAVVGFVGAVWLNFALFVSNRAGWSEGTACASALLIESTDNFALGSHNTTFLNNRVDTTGGAIAVLALSLEASLFFDYSWLLNNEGGSVFFGERDSERAVGVIFGTCRFKAHRNSGRGGDVFCQSGWAEIVTPSSFICSVAKKTKHSIFVQGVTGDEDDFWMTTTRQEGCAFIPTQPSYISQFTRKIVRIVMTFVYPSIFIGFLILLLLCWRFRIRRTRTQKTAMKREERRILVVASHQRQTQIHINIRQTHNNHYSLQVPDEATALLWNPEAEPRHYQQNEVQISREAETLLLFFE